MFAHLNSCPSFVLPSPWIQQYRSTDCRRQKETNFDQSPLLLASALFLPPVWADNCLTPPNCIPQGLPLRQITKSFCSSSRSQCLIVRFNHNSQATADLPDIGVQYQLDP